MVRKTLFLVLVLMVATATASYAECNMCKAASASNKNWPERSANQFLQGFGNMLLGWTQAATEPFKENATNPNPDTGYKLGNGILMGWGKACMSTTAGFLEAVTFWTPVRIVPDTNCPCCGDLPKACKTVATCGKQ